MHSFVNSLNQLLTNHLINSPNNYLSACLDNFYEQSEPGVVCVFSLKNPSFPEYLCHAPSGVMCIDVHPQVPTPYIRVVDPSGILRNLDPDPFFLELIIFLNFNLKKCMICSLCTLVLSCSIVNPSNGWMDHDPINKKQNKNRSRLIMALKKIVKKDKIF